MTEQVGEFVDLLHSENDYEILNVYPFTIQKKSNHKEIKEYLDNDKYVHVKLNGRSFLKHRLIALQFLPNDDPDNLTQVDHINRNRSDYHIENLRWCTQSMNIRNQSSHKGITYQYVDTIPDDAMIVDCYENKTGRYEFKDYYYHDGVFYYNNDINYRILHVNTKKNGTQFVSMNDINGKRIDLFINRFLEQHDLL